jgi:hypothetical protein
MEWWFARFQEPIKKPSKMSNKRWKLMTRDQQKIARDNENTKMNQKAYAVDAMPKQDMKCPKSGKIKLKINRKNKKEKKSEEVQKPTKMSFERWNKKSPYGKMVARNKEDDRISKKEPKKAVVKKVKSSK